MTTAHSPSVSARQLFVASVPGSPQVPHPVERDRRLLHPTPTGWIPDAPINTSWAESTRPFPRPHPALPCLRLRSPSPRFLLPLPAPDAPEPPGPPRPLSPQTVNRQTGSLSLCLLTLGLSPTLPTLSPTVSSTRQRLWGIPPADSARLRIPSPPPPPFHVSGLMTLRPGRTCAASTTARVTTTGRRILVGGARREGG